MIRGMDSLSFFDFSILVANAILDIIIINELPRDSVYITLIELALLLKH